jgi:hypothetical protein
VYNSSYFTSYNGLACSGSGGAIFAYGDYGLGYNSTLVITNCTFLSNTAAGFSTSPGTDSGRDISNYGGSVTVKDPSGPMSTYGMINTVMSADGARSTVTSSPSQVTAAGYGSYATITVTLNDVNGNPVGSGRNIPLQIKKGESTMDIASKLEVNRLIKSKYSFYLKTKLQKFVIMPGTYELRSDMTYNEILAIITDYSASIIKEDGAADTDDNAASDETDTGADKDADASDGSDTNTD